MGEDSSIVFRVDADDKEAQKKLNDIRKDIEKTQKAIEKTNTQHNGIVDALDAAKAKAKETAAEVKAIQDQMAENEAALSGRTGSIDLEEFNARKQAQSEMTAELKEQQKALAAQEKTVQRLSTKESEVAAKLREQRNTLDQQKSDAGAVERVIAQQSEQTMPQLKAAADAASASIRTGFKNILKWGFGIRTAFILVRKLKNYIKEAVLAFAEQDEETKNNINNLKSALNTLKLSWGAAFAPIFNYVAPILQRLIQWLTNAANAVAKFFAILSGKSSYKKAVAANTDLAESYEEAGEAAKEAEGQIMGFDEINKLSAEDAAENAVKTSAGAKKPANMFIDEQIGEFDKMKDHMAQIELLAIGIGAALAAWKLGPVAGEIVALIGGIAMLISGLNEWIDTGEVTSQTLWKIDGGLGLIGIALSLLTGSWIPLAVAAIGGLLFSLPEILGGLADFFHGIGMDGIGNFLDGMAEKAAGAREWIRENIALPVKTWFDNAWLELSTQEHQDEYADGLSWFLCGVLGLPTDEEWINYGLSALDWLAEGFDGFLDEVHNIIGAPLEELIEVELPETFAWFKRIGPDVIQWLWEGFDDFTGELHNIIGGPVEEMVDGIKEGLDGLGSKILEFKGNLYQRLSETWENISEFFGNLRSGVGDTLSDVMSHFDGFHARFAQFREQINEKIQSIINKVKSLLKKLKNLFSGNYNDTSDYGDYGGGVSWNAKGGIVSRASIIGVGEAGREAVLPLDRNTGWIRDLASQIIGQIDSILPPMPAMAAGQIVPPNAQQGGGISEADLARIIGAIQGLGNGSGRSGSHTAIFNVNGREFARAIYEDQQAVATEHGISLISD